MLHGTVWNISIGDRLRLLTCYCCCSLSFDIGLLVSFRRSPLFITDVNDTPYHSYIIVTFDSNKYQVTVLSLLEKKIYHSLNPPPFKNQNQSQIMFSKIAREPFDSLRGITSLSFPWKRNSSLQEIKASFHFTYN